MTAKPKRSAHSNIGELVPKSSSSSLFETVCSMEDDIEAIGDLGHIVELICGAMEDGAAACSLQRLAWEIKGRVEALEGARGTLFRALHPNAAGRAA